MMRREGGRRGGGVCEGGQAGGASTDFCTAVKVSAGERGGVLHCRPTTSSSTKKGCSCLFRHAGAACNCAQDCIILCHCASNQRASLWLEATCSPDAVAGKCLNPLAQVQHAATLKDRGNAAFKDGKLDRAVKFYDKAVSAIRWVAACLALPPLATGKFLGGQHCVGWRWKGGSELSSSTTRPCLQSGGRRLTCHDKYWGGQQCVGWR